MVDTSVSFGGVKFKNPIMIASHAPCSPWSGWPPEKDAPEIQMRLWRKYYEGDVGAITTGTIYSEDFPPGMGGQRFWASKTKGFAEREGFVSAATIPDALWARTNGIEALKRAKKEFTDTRIIASIIVPTIDSEVWGDLALECAQNGADMVELNFGSTMFIDTVDLAREGIKLKEKLPAGVTMGVVPEVMAAMIKGIRKKTDIPVIAKITPEMSFFQALMGFPLLVEAGVKALTLNHTFMSVAPPDIYNGGKTTFSNMDTTTWWSTNGPWHRFAAYRNVSMVAKYLPHIDTIACGGLVLPEHCIEVMMLGAKAVQMSAGIFWNGVSFPGKVVKFLKRYMEDQGYNSVDEFIGLGLKYIVEMGECQDELKSQIGNLIAQVDRDKCVGTSKCNICLDNWCVATYEEDGIPMVDPELCNSCTLCVIRCPHGARYMKKIKG